MAIACIPDTIVLGADPERTGEDGTLGPHEVLFQSRVAQARVEESLYYDWITPTDVEASPIMVFAHGGLVDRSRYRWLGYHMASRGYRVALPAHDADLAITDIGNLSIVIDDVSRRDEEAPIAVGGHSLGGVIATWTWESDERVDALLSISSFPAGDELVRGRGDALAISGSSDGLASVEQVRAGAEQIRPRARTAFVQDMTHFAWTDLPTVSELEREGTTGRDVFEARQDALAVIDAWMDASLRGDVRALDRLEDPFDGVDR